MYISQSYIFKLHVQVITILYYFPASGTTLNPTKPPTKWVQGSNSPDVKWPGREADLSDSSAKVNYARSSNSTPQCVFIAWYLVKDRDNFAFLNFAFAGLSSRAV
jgi:hypothetical protein